MTDISKSPARLTFQKEKYIERCEKEGKLPNPEYLEMFAVDKKRYDNRFESAESKVNNLEYDLLTTMWILEKVRDSDSYAQNIYAALCNNGFIKLDVIPILTEKEWSCSWRYAGGIVADMQQKGDYIDWYCSGIQDEDARNAKAFAPEGYITDEIRQDFKSLGWVPAPGGDWEKFND